MLNYTNIVRRFFAFLDKRGLILRNPAQHLPARRVEQLPPRVLSESQADALMNAPHRGNLVGVRDAAILELFCGTGIRLNECGRLDLQDLDLREGLLLVRNGKVKKDRIVPVSGRAAAALLGHRFIVAIKDLRQVLARAHPRERTRPRKARRYNRS